MGTERRYDELLVQLPLNSRSDAYHLRHKEQETRGEVGGRKGGGDVKKMVLFFSMLSLRSGQDKNRYLKMLPAHDARIYNSGQALFFVWSRHGESTAVRLLDSRESFMVINDERI
ncbi:hypothetical protein GWI33_017519 [Rhynchophorus ferrugineus]|uniref:Uncharacterized protein n=1 Tax=Rhynchophorus ferrugineus TaxID=354439 RepID=A0A834HYM0_RHYFE|nr:hypothetical protein GWI33_017519 [Rhynchophorus ferrugineus]